MFLLSTQLTALTKAPVAHFKPYIYVYKFKSILILLLSSKSAWLCLCFMRCPVWEYFDIALIFLSTPAH